MATTIKRARGPRLDTIEAIQYQLTICSRELRQGCPKRPRTLVLRHADQLLDAWLRMKGSIK